MYSQSKPNGKPLQKSSCKIRAQIENVEKVYCMVTILNQEFYL